MELNVECILLAQPINAS